MRKSRADRSVRSTNLDAPDPLAPRSPWPFPLRTRCLRRILYLALALYVILALLLTLQSCEDRQHILCSPRRATIPAHPQGPLRRSLP
ncbi:hypothetical protein ES703_27576 [subsurface metagenome]